MSFSKDEKLLLTILALAQFSHIVDFMIVMPLGPSLMRLFAVEPHEFGLLVSIYTLSAACSGFLSAGFVDRFDRKRSLQVVYHGFALGSYIAGVVIERGPRGELIHYEQVGYLSVACTLIAIAIASRVLPYKHD